MSKEKQCKCCREWWYASDIKEDLCPNCYDYFKQLKQELEIKNQKIKNLYIDLKDWEDLEEKISTKYENVVSLLKEKDKEIDYWKDKTRNKILNMKATDFMKMCLSCGLVLDITESQVPYIQTIDQLKQQLEEKDKEIERLKVFEKAYYFNQTQVSQESMDLLLQNAYQVHNEIQLAIQELEKVKNFVDGRTYCADYINKRIQELKGEKDVED